MRKAIITLGVIACTALALLSIGPFVYQLFHDRGLQTADLGSGGEPATVEMDGTWNVEKGFGSNHTQAGYTFDEVLPGQRKTTSGRADNSNGESVTGQVQVKGETLKEGKIQVKVADISSDNQKRDNNVRNHILQTDMYPTATFDLTKPVDLSKVPADGTPGSVNIEGDLELHGKRQHIEAPMKVLRTGDKVITQSNLPIKLSDFDVKSPRFVASKISEEGTIDLMLVLGKS